MERATVAALYKSAAEAESAALWLPGTGDDQELTPGEERAIRSYICRLNDLCMLMRNLADRAERRHP